MAYPINPTPEQVDSWPVLTPETTADKLEVELAPELLAIGTAIVMRQFGPLKVLRVLMDIADEVMANAEDDRAYTKGNSFVNELEDAAIVASMIKSQRNHPSNG